MKNQQRNEISEEGGLHIGALKVLRKWTDHNGHMNLAAFLIAFDRCFCEFCNEVGIGPHQIPTTAKTVFVAETHLLYRRELRLADQVDVGIRVIDLSQKRMHTYLSMYHRETGTLVCVNEQLDVCVDLSTRRSCSFPADVHARLDRLYAREGSLPPPAFARRAIQMPLAQSK